jgi:hypothetical protein
VAGARAALRAFLFACSSRESACSKRRPPAAASKLSARGQARLRRRLGRLLPPETYAGAGWLAGIAAYERDVLSARIGFDIPAFVLFKASDEGQTTDSSLPGIPAAAVRSRTEPAHLDLASLDQAEILTSVTHSAMNVPEHHSTVVNFRTPVQKDGRFIAEHGGMKSTSSKFLLVGGKRSSWTRTSSELPLFLQDGLRTLLSCRNDPRGAHR